MGADDPEIMEAIEPEVRRWGTHPSWSRLLGSTQLYIDIEDRLTDLLGSPDTLVLPTMTGNAPDLSAFAELLATTTPSSTWTTPTVSE